ncbi:hypothetical protein [Kaarinaea lacus]
MNFSGNVVRSTLVLTVLLLVSACVAKQDLILPSKEQRVTAVETYKQCVAYATNKRINQNRDAESIVRDSIEKCRSSKHAMLKDYPKNWRNSFEKQVDEELLKTEVAYIRKARGQ